MTDYYECPKCDGELEPTPDNPHYHMCYSCVEGWTTEELNGIRRYKEWLKEKKKEGEKERMTRRITTNMIEPIMDVLGKLRENLPDNIRFIIYDSDQPKEQTLEKIREELYSEE